MLTSERGLHLVPVPVVYPHIGQQPVQGHGEFLRGTGSNWAFVGEAQAAILYLI
jgi:hypothetical protein